MTDNTRSAAKGPTRNQGKAKSETTSTAVPPSLQPYASAEGASIFEVAASKATADDLDKVRDRIGPLDRDLYIKLFQKSQNPIWLWIAIGSARQPEDIPPEAFEYIQRAGGELWGAVAAQACSLETVRVTPGKDLDEAITRGSNSSPPIPDILQILNLAHPGRHLIRAAATEIRDISIAIAVQSNALKTGQSREESRSLMAESLGRTSAEAGPSVISIRHMEKRGRKLASISPRKNR